jgi:hypothetical protein
VIGARNDQPCFAQECDDLKSVSKNQRASPRQRLGKATNNSRICTAVPSEYRLDRNQVIGLLNEQRVANTPGLTCHGRLEILAGLVPPTTDNEPVAAGCRLGDPVYVGKQPTCLLELTQFHKQMV